MCLKEGYKKMKKILILMIFIIIIFICIIVNKTPVDNNTFEDNITVEKPTEEKLPNIIGKYKMKSDIPTTALTYIFSTDKVICMNDVSSEGTYTIENNIIYITYYKTLSPENVPLDFIRESETLTIESENVLVRNDGIKLYKIKGK